MEALALGLFIVAAIALLILSLYSIGSVYVRAGEPGWAVLIPGYNEYVMGKISKRNKYAVWLFIILGILSFILNNIPYILPDNNLLDSIGLAVFAIFLAVYIYIVIGMSKQFAGVSSSFWVFFIFLPFLCSIKLKYLKYKKSNVKKLD